MEYGPIVDAIVDAESRFPVETWIIDGVHVWPLIRLRLYPLFADHFGGTPDVERQIVSSKQSKKGRFLATGAAIFRRLASAPAVANEARVTARRLSEPADVLFYSLSHMRTSVDGKWLDRHCDPLINIMRGERALKCVLLESAYDVPHRVPRANNELAIEVDSWVRFVARRGNRSHGGNTRMQSYGEFLRWLQKTFVGLDSSALSVRALAREVRSVTALRDAFERVLAESGARVCFVVCYYHDPAMALAWACRRAGIPCVDLQHGMQANPAYTRWTKIPDGGYELLPEIFWNWTRNESVGIRSWADRTNGAHRSIVGGFPWLDMFGPPAGARVAAPENLRILFSMPTFAYELPAWVLAAIAASPAGWTWSFRLHPRQQKAREDLRSMLQQTNTQAAWELDTASDLPLPTVLQNTDVHVTHSSSVVIEAEYFGIRTVAIQQDAARSFENQSLSGVLVVATDPAALIEAVKVQGSIRQRTSTKQVSGREHTLQAIDTLLQIARA